MYRDHTKVIKIGNRVIGGGNPILIQSMTNTKTEDVKAGIVEDARFYFNKTISNFVDVK